MSLSELASIKIANFSLSTYGTFTHKLSTTGAVGDGVITIPFETKTGGESLGNCILSEGDYVSIQRYTKWTILEPTGCGLEDTRLQDKMKKEWQRSLTNLSESLFGNYGKENRKSDYEQKSFAQICFTKPC